MEITIPSFNFWFWHQKITIKPNDNPPQPTEEINPYLHGFAHSYAPCGYANILGPLGGQGGIGAEIEYVSPDLRKESGEDGSAGVVK